MKPASVRRWEARFADAGVAGLLAERKGPKRKSKLTAATVAAIAGLRDGGASYRAIAAATGVSQGSVRTALRPRRRRRRCRGALRPSRFGWFPPASRARARARAGGGARARAGAGGGARAGPSLRLRRIAPQRFPMIRPARAAVQVPVLADPVDRGGSSGCWRGSG